MKGLVARKSEVNHVLGRLFSFVHQRKLRKVAEAFQNLTNLGLIQKEFSLNLTLMSIQLSDMRKRQLRDAFSLLKQRFGQVLSRDNKKRLVLKKILKEDKFRADFVLREVLLKWNTAAIKLSACTEIQTARYIHEITNEKNALRRLRNLFASKKQHNKSLAFFKIRHNNQNLKGAANLFTLLDKKTWNKKRFGFEGISAYAKSSAIINRNQRAAKLTRFSEILNKQLQKNFKKLSLNSRAVTKAPVVKMNVKKGLLRLCVISDDLRERALLHGLKMIELFNIHKRNQKSLYLNLSLKLLLLFEDKEIMYKQEFLRTIYTRCENDILRKRLLEKLLRRAHTRNIATCFNRFKSEIVNVKLNHSIVNLAIKDIILAIEKLSRLQRSKKALFFRKLNMFNWEKQQVNKGVLSMNYIWDKPNIQKENAFGPRGITSLVFPGINGLRGISSIESLDLDTRKYNEEERIAKLKNISNLMQQKSRENKLHAFT